MTRKIDDIKASIKSWESQVEGWKNVLKGAEEFLGAARKELADAEAEQAAIDAETEARFCYGREGEEMTEAEARQAMNDGLYYVRTKGGTGLLEAFPQAEEDDNLRLLGIQSLDLWDYENILANRGEGGE